MILNPSAGGSRDLDPHVVIGTVVLLLPVERAPGVIVKVLRAIPSFVTKIDSSAESDLAIDNADLLVVGSAERMPAIEKKMHAGMNVSPDVLGSGLALDRVK